MVTALFSASFDPPTYGHLDLIERAAKLVDRLYVAVALGKEKSPLFTLEERQQFLIELFSNRPNISFVVANKATVKVAQELGVRFLIRGIRSYLDYEYEKELSEIQKRLTNIETLFLLADPKFSEIRGRWIREMVAFDLPLKDYLPLKVAEATIQKLRSQ